MAIGAWYAAGNYRTFDTQFTAYKESEEGKQTNRHNQRRREASTDLENGEDIFPDEIVVENIGEDATSTSRLEKEKDDEMVKKNKNPNKKKKQKQEVWSLHSLPPPERKKKKKKNAMSKRNDSSDNFGATQIAATTATTTNSNPIPNGTNNIEEEAVIPARESGTVAFEMNHWHVLMFVVTASLTLILLYFFKGMYKIIFVIYGLGCARAVSDLIISPLVGILAKKLGKSWEEDLIKPLFCGMNGYSVTSLLIAYIWAAVWLWYGIKHYRPQTNAFFWLTLDIFGACVCILGVSVLKLNSIKIATILLVAIFFYDIFFVFITPFLTGGKSVMLDVATGSAPDPSEEDHCYKYPEDCQGIGFLPMIFIFPQINDYADGSTILGLGDIICKSTSLLCFMEPIISRIFTFVANPRSLSDLTLLLFFFDTVPGFLIAFCARHDAAARLIGIHSPENEGIIDVPIKWYEGYFFSMMLAYSSGLFFAFMAVILMEQGQPALLYICPICLATIFCLGRKDWKDLWNGAKVFQIADKLIKKTERKWGKERMKHFAEQRRRENTTLGTSSGNEGEAKPHSRRRSLEPNTHISNNLSPTATKTDSTEDTQPVSKDVCFGYEGHPGTIAFRTVVEEVATDLGEEEYRPEIYKIIKKKLKGRRFFKNDDIIWAEATKLEARKEIGIAYDQARGRVSSVLEDFDPLSLPTL